MNIFKKTKDGFTLIELLVVIAIIALLSSIILASLSAARSKARDGDRMETLISLRDALELYYTKHGKYPSTGGAIYVSDLDIQNDFFAGTNGGNWIPGLAADGDIGTLPHDPRPGVAVTGCDPTDYWWGTPESAEYAYFSTNGSGYALASVCGSEGGITASSLFFDSWMATQGFTDYHTLKICVAGSTADCSGGQEQWF